MRLWKFGAAALTLGVSLSLVALTGCSSNSPSTAPKEDKPPKPPKDGDNTPSTKRTPVLAGKGVIKGKVTLAGDPPIDKLNEKLEPTMKGQDDHSHCLAPKAGKDKEQQVWRVGEGNALANVVVFLVPEKGTFFACTDKDEGVKAVKDKAAELHQPFCAFHPHVSVHFPVYRNEKNEEVKTGQKIVVYNDTNKAEGGKPGGISHNTKWGGGTEQTTGNVNIPPKETREITDAIPSKTEPITFSCSIHGWMNAIMFVLDHPYYAVTDEKGEFTIKNVPAGKVRIVVWHEGANYINEGGKDGEAIEVKDDEVKKDFTAKAK